MKIGIIGFGAAAIGFIERIKNENHEIHIFEKSKDIYSSSISGIRADGKLFVSREMGGDLLVDPLLQKQLVDFYIARTSDGKFESGKSFANKENYIKFYSQGFQPILSDFYHLGTDQLKEVLLNIYKDFSSHDNIKFHFSHEVTHIETIANKVIMDNEYNFDKLIVAVGRSGHKLVKKIIGRYPQLVMDNTKVDLGIRYEIPNHVVEELNREMYEFKIKYRSKTGYTVRTFCNNPSGFVVTENYGDYVTVNGHSKIHEKSKNTNFAILTTVKLTEPFDDPIGYGSNIAKLSNLLSGKDKVILQTWENFCKSKRTKNLYRVLPTLPEKNYILGDINLAFPRRIIESIIDFVENLNKIVPGVANADNLVYAPEIKFYSNRISSKEIDNLMFAGDCSGETRSIIYATAHGWLTAERLINFG